MKLSRLLTLALSLCLTATALVATDVDSQWRGPNRDGKYHGESLLKRWPDGGPELIWDTQGLGQGHSSAAVTDQKIYVTGMLKESGTLFAYDLDGKKLWQTEYGKEWTGDYPGARCTPTVVGELLYLQSGQGKVVCLDSNTGKIKWSVELFKKFEAENIRWGMAESLLIDGDNVIATPGGPHQNVGCLDQQGKWGACRLLLSNSGESQQHASDHHDDSGVDHRR
jgi:outer membrane protein assembly factor BamB